ncbi:catechol 2,3-dioxygenase-like lactoylglutathione lyase family enzyme [Thermocatellispora tengchongensis]|uniref:Catechol 2,3-dioxygenase-like lactoylglutathione lyase family enzyme n=1 Tax=Thermocatellispora tengchongensis TaxID=1073253 RepID=A0A840P0E5_9ACTN|nr:VOC family protein [Thermocatellispora tengchongensis]MBB5134684.1 catechol 2,3-dioxygenase-like lactoylglutathione lyase family enzyme [Thermocatellispora tengchongensis]
MSVELNHTIVRATDQAASAEFLARILGLPVGRPWGPFLPVELGNRVTLDYLQVERGEVQPQHYAFLVSEAEFDAAFARIREAGLTYYADPFRRRPGEINHHYGGRGVYFDDPDGHSMELITTPYGEHPEG